MKKLINLTLLSLFMGTINSQNLDFGKYRLNMDGIPTLHLHYTIDIRADSTYEFTYVHKFEHGFGDHTDKSRGRWKIDTCNYILFTPDIIPDSINLDVHERRNDQFDTNIVDVKKHYYEPFANFDLNIFQRKRKTTLRTDSLGVVEYVGRTADSITFTIKGREMTVIPKRKINPSKIQLHINIDNKDLIHSIGIYKLLIENKQLSIRHPNYITGNGEEITSYFKRID